MAGCCYCGSYCCSCCCRYHCWLLNLVWFYHFCLKTIIKSREDRSLYILYGCFICMRQTIWWIDCSDGSMDETKKKQQFFFAEFEYFTVFFSVSTIWEFPTIWEQYFSYFLHQIAKIWCKSHSASNIEAMTRIHFFFLWMLRFIYKSIGHTQ